MKKVGNIVRIALIIVVIALIFMNLKNGFEININYSEMISAIKQEKVKTMPPGRILANAAALRRV